MSKKKTIRNSHIARYEQYLSEDPDNIVLLTTLGDLYHQAGDLQRAVNCFKQCLIIDKDNIVASICLAKVLISGHRFHLAENLLRKLINRGHDNESIQHDLGLCLYYEQRWSEAENIFQKIKHVGNTNLQYLIHCLHNQHQLGKAIALSKEWLRRAPEHGTEGYISLLEMDHGSLVIAQKRAHHVLQSSPENIHANLVCSMNAIRHQKWNRAKKHLHRAADTGAQHPRIFIYLALVKLAEQNHASAIEILRHINPNCAKALLFTLLGWCQLINDKHLLAEEYFKRALAVNNSYESAHSGLSITYILQQSHNKAREHLNKAQAIAPDSMGASIAEQFLLQIDNETNPSFYSQAITESLKTDRRLISYLSTMTLDNSTNIADLHPLRNKQHTISDVIMLMSQSTDDQTASTTSQEA